MMQLDRVTIMIKCTYTQLQDGRYQ